MSIKSKIFTCILSIVMLVSLLPTTTVFAAELDNSNIKIENAVVTASGKCGKTLNWKIEYHNLIISGKGKMYNYKAGTAPWYKYNNDIEKITINNGITHIGNYAFYNIGVNYIPLGNNQYVREDGVAILSISNAKTLKTIGSHAFDRALNNGDLIKLPNKVTSIGSYAFANCNLEILLPTSLKTIGASAFRNSKLDPYGRFYIPKKVTSIGNYAFYNCNLYGIYGGAGLKTIGTRAFSKNDNLKSFRISSKKLKKIGKFAFSGCKKLTVLNIPNTTALTRKGTIGSLEGSSIKTIKVKSYKVKYYKKYFQKSWSGRKVTVKKA